MILLNAIQSRSIRIIQQEFGIQCNIESSFEGSLRQLALERRGDETNESGIMQLPSGDNFKEVWMIKKFCARGEGMEGRGISGLHPVVFPWPIVTTGYSADYEPDYNCYNIVTNG